jgi:serine/threonine protein kinase
VEDLERWTPVLPLGAGAFGEVHLAWDSTDRRWVALKRFTGQDELGLLRFVIESRIRVSHPHLVRTLAFRLVDDRAWLVTELARGGSLRSLMASHGALPSDWVAEAVDQVLQALEALHATGVVHRDLKPANLLLRSHGTEPPHLLVGDFGIATWRTVSMTGIGAAIGTPGYLAPEYLDGHQPSPATDLFAVGVLAAELLTGRRLVHYSNASPGMPSSWTHTLPLPPSVPTALGEVLARMAAPDPARRYTDCAQAREALLRAAPATARGDLTAVPTPDLLASVPPGWTADGPEAPTTHLSAASPFAAPLIDGGPTALVVDAPEAGPSMGAVPQTPSAAAPSAAAPTPPGGWPSGSSTQPRSGSATYPATSPSGSATQPPTFAPARRKKPARKLRRAALLITAIVLAGTAGTLWWMTENRAVSGSPTATEVPQGMPTASEWDPEILEPCSVVDISRERADGTERCQRTRDTDTPQNWVAAPPGGFPAKSDHGGPFTFEPCGTKGDFAYSPIGDHLYCSGTAWTLVH